MPSIHLAWNPKHVIVQWVGIGTHTQALLCDTHLCLSVILKMLTGQEFLEVYENMGAKVRAKGWMMIKHLPTELLQEMCLAPSRVWP